MEKSQVIEALKSVTKNPGIYLWKNKEGKVIYVGKAKNLNKRMHQYFDGAINSYKTHKLVDEITDFEVFITHTNKEALLLEKTYIEKYNPEYNILLLDDKRYPYIKIELKNNKLEIKITRKINKKNSPLSYYFGPFPTGYGVSDILKWLEHEAYYEKGLKIQNKDSEFWINQFNKIKDILSFKDANYFNNLKQQMYVAAEQEQFEVARNLRDVINKFKALKESQIVELKNMRNLDVFAYRLEQNTIYITMLFYRYGMLINKDNQVVNMTLDLNESLENFFKTYYQDKIVPDEILATQDLIDLNLNLPEELVLSTPKIGANKHALDVAYLNLENYYNNEKNMIANRDENALKLLQTLSQLIPNISFNNIIVFDNSNINNFNPVGVAIVYTNGLKNKNMYRKFNLDVNYDRKADVAYMNQSIRRYFSDDKNFKAFNLLIVDGGLPQVHEARKVMNNLGFSIPIVGLVKDDFHRTRALINLKEKEIDLKNYKDLHNFLAEIQIEVDRFAKSHLRKREKISSLEGSLLSIKGLGKQMETKLLAYFKTYAAIYDASLAELNKVVPKDVALKIFNKNFVKK